jgi:hypothetical protein
MKFSSGVGVGEAGVVFSGPAGRIQGVKVEIIVDVGEILL